MSIKTAHEKLGHMSEEITRKTARTLGWPITRGSLKTCEPCALGKSKQKNVPQVSEAPKATVNGQRWFLDISSVKTKEGQEMPLYPNWRIMVEERTGLKISHFYKTKRCDGGTYL